MKKQDKLYCKITDIKERELLSLNALLAEKVGEYAKLPVVREDVIAKSYRHHNNLFDSFIFHKNISRIIKNNFYENADQY